MAAAYGYNTASNPNIARLRAKLVLILNLAARPGTQGERDAAHLAAERIKAALKAEYAKCEQAPTPSTDEIHYTCARCGESLESVLGVCQTCKARRAAERAAESTWRHNMHMQNDTKCYCDQCSTPKAQAKSQPKPKQQAETQPSYSKSVSDLLAKLSRYGITVTTYKNGITVAKCHGSQIAAGDDFTTVVGSAVDYAMKSRQ